jgi:hypothetical protein
MPAAPSEERRGTADGPAVGRAIDNRRAIVGRNRRIVSFLQVTELRRQRGVDRGKQDR